MRRQSDFLPKLKHKILLWMKLGESIMNKTINLILAILSVITYIGIIVMKFYTQINIPNGSFVIMTLLFIISVCQFLNSLK